MLQCKIILKKDSLIVVETQKEYVLADLMHESEALSEWMNDVDGQRVCLDISREACHRQRRSRWGTSFHVQVPDTSVYFPILDLFDRNGITISKVLLGGRSPFYPWNRFIECVALGVGFIAMGASIFCYTSLNQLDNRVTLKRAARDRFEANNRHVIYRNHELLHRIGVGAGWIQSHYGVVLAIRATPKMTEIAALFPSNEGVDSDSNWRCQSRGLSSDWNYVDASSME